MESADDCTGGGVTDEQHRTGPHRARRQRAAGRRALRRPGAAHALVLLGDIASASCEGSERARTRGIEDASAFWPSLLYPQRAK